MDKKNIALLFGGKSPEHEVSVVTGLQTLNWLDGTKYNVFLIYIDPLNKVYLCPKFEGNFREAIDNTLAKKQYIQFTYGGIIVKTGFFNKFYQIDVALLAMHGGSGENGCLQGLLEYYGIAYTGSGVLGSSLGMDKVIMKDVFSQNKLPILPFVWFTKSDFEFDPKVITEKINKNLKYPIFVKPVRSGSSLGISRIKSENSLKEAIEKAAVYDFKIIVEEELKEALDINCAVIGGEVLFTSLCEQPLKEEEFLSFDEKYLKGGKKMGMAGLSRIVPAPIPDKIASEIQNMAKTIFKSLDCWGSARVDFLYQKSTGKVFPCEINTIPGSLSSYLWQASGMAPKEMVDKLIELALERQTKDAQLSYSYKSKILDQDNK